MWGLGVRNDPSGLLYVRHRYYDPHLGRWLTPDPIGFSGGLNLYTYVENSPVNFVDPSGLQGAAASVAQSVAYQTLGYTLADGGISGGGPFSFEWAATAPIGGGLSALARSGASRVAPMLSPTLSRWFKWPFSKKGLQPIAFYKGCPPGARISLKQAAEAASKAGIDMRMFELRGMQSSPGLFGAMFQTATNELYRGETGRIVIGLTAKALSCPKVAVKTIAHELNHVRGVLKTGIPTPETLAKYAEKMAERHYKP